MSLTDRKLAWLISDSTPFLTGTPVVLNEVPTINNDGWDLLVRTEVRRRATFTPEEVAAAYPVGGRLGTRNWWLTAAKPTKIAPGVWKVESSFKGWAATKPAVIRVGANADQQSGENIRAPDHVGDTVGSVYAKVETHENMPTIAVSYLVETIGTGRTAEVGTAQTLPVTIAVPATVWTFLTEFVYHWPNGWVLMSSEQDRLPGTTAALVTDNYKYVREKTPG
jgi:hypothetical protein